MAENLSLEQAIDISNPEFKKAFSNSIIQDNSSGNVYKVDGATGALVNLGKQTDLAKLGSWNTMLDARKALGVNAEAIDTANPNRSVWDQITAAGNVTTYDYANGLSPVGRGTYQTSEAFKYYKSNTTPQEQVESNFGMGRTIAPEEYTGETTVFNGKTVYKLKNGEATAQAPGGTMPNYYGGAGQPASAEAEALANSKVKSAGTAKTSVDISGIDPVVLSKPGISALVSSGKEFNETDAQNFAYANGDKNYQQYIGGVGGQVNPLYIGATNWANLQKQYTPYQLSQSTVRTKDGIYWKEGVNISELPAEDPTKTINKDASKISDILTDAKKSADKFTSESAKKSEAELTDDKETNESTLMSMLQNTYGDSAESLYNELFNTSEIKNAQSDVNDLKSELDKYDEQMEELKNDVRNEVEGEASDSYITALATVRGEKILKLKRSTQRDYDTALANYNSLITNANNLLTVRTKDADNRYNRLFSMLQLQIQEEGTNFNQSIAMAQLAMQIPEGRSMTVNGQKITGLKENDDLNVVQFTDESGNNYVLGIDKKTGDTKYKTYIGKSKVSGGSGTEDKAVDLNTALYWLSLVKKEDGTFDLNSIPSDIRTGVVDVISKNKSTLPKPEQTFWEKSVDVVQGAAGAVGNAIGNWWDQITGG
jgi:hypothetical protein